MSSNINCFDVHHRSSSFTLHKALQLPEWPAADLGCNKWNKLSRIKLKSERKGLKKIQQINY